MNKENLEERIKHVAIYLRKSRAEEGERDLINHENRLLEIARDKGWSYEIYKEIGSGSSIDARKKMLELLSDMKKGMFDAVLVMDVDRLSRSAGDQERIFNELRIADMLVVTGASYSVLDPFNDSDTDMYHFKSFFSYQEAKIIKRRFREAKRAHRERGHWVSGRAPFGYKYNKATKRLVIKPDESEIVKRVIKEFVWENKMPGDIAWGLNKDGLLSQTGALWSSTMISRLLKNDIYLGQTTYNKSHGTKKSSKDYTPNSIPFKKFPKSEWKVMHNTHEALVTPEERDVIDEYFKNWRSKTKARINKDGDVFDLSGLCVNSQGMTYTRQFDRQKLENEVMTVSPDSRLPKEQHPKYRRMNVHLVRETIHHAIKQMEQELEERLEQNDNKEEVISLEKQMNKLEKQYKVILDSFDRLVEGYAEGIFDLDTMKKAKEKKEIEQLEVEEDIRSIRNKIDTLSNSKNLNRLDRVRKFQKDIKEATSNQEINILYKSIIKQIVCDQLTETKSRIKINFL